MPENEGPDAPEEAPTGAAPARESEERPLFLHPRWTVGVVLIFGVAAIFAGMNDPVWFIIGAPCILVLIVYVWVRVWGGRRP
jgi:hypothetical protein